MPKETMRQRAERIKLARNYFQYADDDRYYGYWLPQYLKTAKMDEFICRECNYVPRPSSMQPRRAFRAHIKKSHPLTWFSEYAKPFIIQEEDEISLEHLLASAGLSLV